MFEETGIKECKIVDAPFIEEKYTFELNGKTYDKTNYFFIGIVNNMETKTPEEFKHEIEDMKWLPYPEAMKLATFDTARDVLKKASQMLGNYYYEKDKIKNNFESEGIDYQVEYSDSDDFSVLPLEKCRQVYGACFLGNEIIIARSTGKGTWGLPGGTIEQGETIEQTLKREIMEETNTNVIKWLPIGYQKVIHPNGSYIYQLRCACSVEKKGEFVSDPAGHVSEIKLINPTDYKKYFDWGDIGKRIIQRGLKLKKSLQ